MSVESWTDERCASCGKRRPLVEITLSDGAGTFRMCCACAANHIREVGAKRIAYPKEKA